MTLTSSLLAPLAAAALIAASASGVAAHPEGQYRCTGKAGSLTSLISFSALGYRLVSLGANGKRDPKGLHGTGTYDYDAPRLIPIDGPLAFQLSVSGTVSKDESQIKWKGGGKVLVACQR